MEKPKYKPALLVIDMQTGFTDPKMRLYSPGAVQILSPLNELTAAARRADVPVIWVNQEHRRQLVDFGREADISPIHCVEGTPAVKVRNSLVVGPDDYVVIKRRYSGFYCTDLEVLLRSLNCNTVILTGAATDGCVLATAMDAHARDYYVRVVTEATVTGTDARRDAALEIMSHMQPNLVINQEEAIQQFNADQQSVPV